MQGVGTSTLLKELVGEEWFLSPGMDVGSKDFFQQLRGKWLIELAELDSLSRGEVSQMKAVLTMTADSYRAPYSKHSTNYPRQCVFTGTTQMDALPEGREAHRSFCPVAVTSVVHGGVRMERLQLWAEATSRYLSGETWHLTNPVLEGEQEQRRQVDPWETEVAKYLHGKRIATCGVAASEVFEALTIPLGVGHAPMTCGSPPSSGSSAGARPAPARPSYVPLQAACPGGRMRPSKKPHNSLDARLQRLRQRGGLADMLGGGSIRTSTHAMVVVEGERSVIVDRDEALRRIALVGWCEDRALEHWLRQLRDPALPGLPTFYVAPDCGDANGAAVWLAWEDEELPEPEADDDDDLFEQDGYWDA